MLKKLFTVALLATLCHVKLASAAYVAGTDYTVLDVKPIPAFMLATNQKDKKAVKVVEFFSYGCPWCYKLDPSIQQWLKTKPKNVEFERVPVLFQPAWSMFVKVFYVATDLQVENSLHTQIFTAVQNNYGEDPKAVTGPLLIQAVDFSTDQGITRFFSQHGVSPEKVQAALKNQAKLDQQAKTATELTKAFKVMEVPMVVINGKYTISNSNTNGDDKKFIDTLNYLIAN